MLSSISNKTEANAALNDFVELAWKGLDKQSFDSYQESKAKVEVLQQQLTAASEFPIFELAKNAKGKLTLKGIKTLLGTVEPNQEFQLETYLDLDKQIKSQNKVIKPAFAKGQKQVNEALKIGSDSVFLAEVKVVQSYLAFVDKVASVKAELKEAQEALDLLVFNKYPVLTIDEVKALIVDDKWLATLQTNIVAEIERVTQQMANRVKQLEERYSTPMPTLSQSVEELSDKVAGHLKAMGLEWSL
ncbi:type I restriction-modification system [Vibrio ishigakensis]|uniref:Type I restriction-modification system n=1 Tax=Vibrio ishigakensis TaxID=1481914 RepID=A0A0B8PBE9_9VIBR|nr:type I restriction-modification system [Vibrio ishigakensis]